ncbi:serine hydrolase domain-containing protein [Polaribacter sp. Hel1_85]|uniref:serine hydrolase domain-containing protein n=1 Tax=Polaribacter sp. Hel1_85 TaxID=1250005 RepID=UPI00052C501B|nr:serine hydrolase [Polaribacter sp. Hel1_85]KGL62378.1 beta-lactamase [Polaribacter sp. Hel1_85]
MKTFKRFLLLLLILLISAVIYNYPKLNILAGYSAKSTASSVFVADRTLAFTDTTDNNFSPVNLASDEVDLEEKTAISSVFNLLTRKAIIRKGLGSVLTLTEEDETASYLSPKRLKADNSTPFPYGNSPQKDTVFSNVNYQKLNVSIDSLFKKRNKTRAVVVIYKDQIISEKYAEGFNKDSRILGWSMTKSILSTVFGVMQHQGKLNVNDKAPIKSWQNDNRKNITINNLLQMNSGLEWDENYDEISDATKMLFLERDMTKMQENKPLVGKPNETFNYSSGTTNLLSGILRSQFKTHQEYLDFWYTNFIDKIGMNSMILEADLSGNYVGSSYSWATTRDWAKFGLLYLKNGNWNGKQLFTKSWVDYITTPTNTSKGIYGAQFWLNASGGFKEVPKNMYYADGYQGQRVYVLPDQDMVIVRFGLTNFDENEFLKGVISSIE